MSARALKPDCDCLECRIGRAVDGYYAENGDRDPVSGHHLIDSSEAIAKLQTVAGELIAGLRDRGQRRAALKFAHDALDAGVRAARSGAAEYVTVESAAEH
ncbi:hypothetical protein MKK75_03105 [Methylobacterium sp. J-030]|uniref:hypothetical protein n=1 Tax=Methylobacterium sp. J-030 TaxID=2836627 RepID=UPI001FB873C0|nr:hypothetical protein [Methylobacterium sp. J-030]MCJ2067804.1 hypothetical protein [Methylobacterium sp. J-030]